MGDHSECRATWDDDRRLYVKEVRYCWAHDGCNKHLPDQHLASLHREDKSSGYLMPTTGISKGCPRENGTWYYCSPRVRTLPSSCFDIVFLTLFRPLRTGVFEFLYNSVHDPTESIKRRSCRNCPCSGSLRGTLWIRNDNSAQDLVRSY